MGADEGYDCVGLFAIALREPLPAIPLIGSFIIKRASIKGNTLRATRCIPPSLPS